MVETCLYTKNKIFVLVFVILLFSCAFSQNFVDDQNTKDQMKIYVQKFVQYRQKVAQQLKEQIQEVNQERDTLLEKLRQFFQEKKFYISTEFLNEIQQCENLADFEKLISKLTSIKEKLSINFADVKAKYQVEFDKNTELTKKINDIWSQIQRKIKQVQQFK